MSPHGDRLRAYLVAIDPTPDCGTMFLAMEPVPENSVQPQPKGIEVRQRALEAQKRATDAMDEAMVALGRAKRALNETRQRAVEAIEALYEVKSPSATRGESNSSQKRFPVRLAAAKSSRHVVSLEDLYRQISADGGNFLIQRRDGSIAGVVCGPDEALEEPARGTLAAMLDAALAGGDAFDEKNERAATMQGPARHHKSLLRPFAFALSVCATGLVITLLLWLTMRQPEDRLASGLGSATSRAPAQPSAAQRAPAVNPPRNAPAVFGLRSAPQFAPFAATPSLSVRRTDSLADEWLLQNSLRRAPAISGQAALLGTTTGTATTRLQPTTSPYRSASASARAPSSSASVSLPDERTSPNRHRRAPSTSALAAATAVTTNPLPQPTTGSQEPSSAAGPTDTAPASIPHPVRPRKPPRAAEAEPPTPGQHVTEQVAKRVIGEPHVSLLSLLPSRIAAHQSATLCVSAVGADLLYVSAVGEISPNQTTCLSVRPGRTTAYVATAVNEARRTTRTVTLTVAPSASNLHEASR